MEKLINILTTLGLTKNESIIYLTAYSCGEATSGEIAKKARINRITTYEILKRLVNKEIASIVIKKNIKYFSVIGPDRLFQRYKSTIEDFQNNMKSFLAIKKSLHNQPKIIVYKGIKGIKEIYEDFISKPNITIYSITKPQFIFNSLGRKYLNKNYAIRKKKGIKVKTLAPYTSDGVYLKNEDKKAERKTKLFPQKYDIPNEIIIYQNKLVLISKTNQLTVVIKDEEISKSFRIVWQMIWDKI